MWRRGLCACLQHQYGVVSPAQGWLLPGNRFVRLLPNEFLHSSPLFSSIKTRQRRLNSLKHHFNTGSARQASGASLKAPHTQPHGRTQILRVAPVRPCADSHSPRKASTLAARRRRKTAARRAGRRPSVDELACIHSGTHCVYGGEPATWQNDQLSRPGRLGVVAYSFAVAGFSLSRSFRSGPFRRDDVPSNLRPGKIPSR